MSTFFEFKTEILLEFECWGWGFRGWGRTGNIYADVLITLHPYFTILLDTIYCILHCIIISSFLQNVKQSTLKPKTIDNPFTRTRTYLTSPLHQLIFKLLPGTPTSKTMANLALASRYILHLYHNMPMQTSFRIVIRLCGKKKKKTLRRRRSAC